MGPGETWMRRSYFQTLSLVVLALTLWSFSDNLVWNVGQPSNGDPKFIVHGLFCLAWVSLLAVQAWLVHEGNLRLHRKLGVAGALVALGVTLSTLYVFVAVWKGWDAMAFYLKANRLLLPGYAVWVVLGVLNRRRPDWHKRCMAVATLYMLEPVLSRAFDPLNPLLDRFPEAQVDFAWWMFFVVTWNGLFASLLLYDWRVARRIHPVTLGGCLGFYAVWVVVLLV